LIERTLEKLCGVEARMIKGIVRVSGKFALCHDHSNE
jgi:hypothetical protein